MYYLHYNNSVLLPIQYYNIIVFPLQHYNNVLLPFQQFYTDAASITKHQPQQIILLIIEEI